MQEQTPLEQAAGLTEATGNNFLLKREDLQPVSRTSTIPRHSKMNILITLGSAQTALTSASSLVQTMY